MRVSKDMLNRWRKYADLLLRENNRTIESITTLSTVWAIAHKLDIPREAYHAGLNDNHIETALKRIFTRVAE